MKRLTILLAFILAMCAGCSRTAKPVTEPDIAPEKAITKAPLRIEDTSVKTPSPVVDVPEETNAPADEIDEGFALELVAPEGEYDETEQALIEDLIKLETEQFYSKEELIALLAEYGYSDYDYLIDALNIPFGDAAVGKILSVLPDGPYTRDDICLLLNESGFTEAEAETAYNSCEKLIIRKAADQQLLDGTCGPAKLVTELINMGYPEDVAEVVVAEYLGDISEIVNQVFKNWMNAGWSEAEVRSLMREAGWTIEELACVEMPQTEVEEIPDESTGTDPEMPETE